MSFPWDSLKAETLRGICKQTLEQSENMVAFLKDVETRAAAHAPPVSHDNAGEPAPKRPKCEDMDTSAESSESEPTCPCADGLSPRMRFILNTVAAVASDVVRDTGNQAIEFGHIEGVWMTQYIPVEELPRGRKSIARWLEGFSFIFKVIHKIFEANRVPTLDTLLETLDKLPNADRSKVDAYTKLSDIEYALSGLVQQAKEDWEDEFEATHCDKEWDLLPACAKHDFDWTLAQDILVG